MALGAGKLKRNRAAPLPPLAESHGRTGSPTPEKSRAADSGPSAIFRAHRNRSAAGHGAAPCGNPLGGARMERHIPIESVAPCVDGGRAEFWWRWVGASLLGAYLDEMAAASLIPKERGGTALLLEVALLEKGVYELNNRPGWVGIPLRGIALRMGREGG